MTTTIATANPLSLTTEEQLESRYNNEIRAFWQQGQFSSFTGVDDVKIRYAQFSQANNPQCLVIVPGRSEGYLKYQELAYDISRLGFDIYIIDHRGQGLSERMLANKHKGYVNHFDDYSEDLNTFVNDVVSKDCKKDVFLLAHSMGGAISARYLQLYPGKIKAAVLASPMIAINSGGIPTWLASAIINTGDGLATLFGQDSWYFLGQGEFEQTPFEENQLMQSKARYKIFTDLYQQQTDLQLGGVTYRWLNEALAVNENLFADINKLNTPVQVLQAGDDTVVDNQAQFDFCAALNQSHEASCPGGKPFVVAEARHEIFFETDALRQQGIEEVMRWFTEHGASMTQ
ncbi:alpha/beta fold hydrolase [Thalassotalea euphylliae]|uniref:alpha/beta fold hydrolase n=1 Tax=Thalassotalea euphylliae TaxID=1655234 RepID=UPI00363E83F1